MLTFMLQSMERFGQWIATVISLTIALVAPPTAAEAPRALIVGSTVPLGIQWVLQ